MSRCMIMTMLALLISAGILLFPVNAEDVARPDTSGSDLDIGAIAVGILHNDIGVIMSPPHWQWDAARYKEEGDKCVAGCESKKKEYVQALQPNENYPYLADKRTSSYKEMMAFCDCARKNYNSALALTGKKDYEGQARILESASGLYAALDMKEEQERVENLARAARAADAAQSIFLPLPAWITVCGIIGGLFLAQRKRK